MQLLYKILLAVFVILLVIFCFQNLRTEEVDFLGWSMQMPMPVLIIVVYLLGMVSGWSVLSFLRRSWEGARGQKKGE